MVGTKESWCRQRIDEDVLQPDIDLLPRKPDRPSYYRRLLRAASITKLQSPWPVPSP